jgi:hypothetical protein
VLAAILFPVFARVRESARRASCQSNLKQIGLAISQYAQDYDEHCPVGEQSIVGSTLAARLARRHFEGANHIFADGHVGSISRLLTRNRDERRRTQISIDGFG